MNRGKPGSSPSSSPPATALPTTQDWLERIAALDATEPPPTTPRPRNTRKAARRKAVTIVARLVLLVLLAIALAVAAQLMWVK